MIINEENDRAILISAVKSELNQRLIKQKIVKKGLEIIIR